MNTDTTAAVGDSNVARGDDAGTPAVDRLSGHPWTATDVWAAVVVGLATIVVAFVWRTEIVPTDPWHYVHSALRFPSSSWVPLGYTRYGMILPVGPLALIFRDAQVTYYFWPLLASGVLAACVYLLGRRWWGPIAGLLAVVLMLSNTILFLNLSRGYPDVISTAIFCLALVFALVARDRLVSGGAFPARTLLIVGFLLGWSFEARETSVLAWPVIALVLWRRDSLWRTLAWVAAPIAAWAAIDIGIGAFAYGDPLLKLHTFTRQDLSTATNPADLAAQAQFVNRSRPYYLTVIPQAALHVPGGIWMLVLGALASVAVLLKDRAVRLMAAWFLIVYLLFVGIGGMFFPGHPAGRLDVQRYWIPFFPASALAVAGLAATVVAFSLRRLEGRVRPGLVMGGVALLVAAGPLVSLARFTTSAPVFATNGATDLQELRAHLTTQHVHRATIWSDFESVRLLPTYQRGPFGGSKLWTAQFRSITGKDATPKPGDYVVIVGRSNSSCSFCRLALAPWLAKHPTVPSTWGKEFVSSADNLTLYRVR